MKEPTFTASQAAGLPAMTAVSWLFTSTSGTFYMPTPVKDWEGRRSMEPFALCPLRDGWHVATSGTTMETIWAVQGGPTA